MFLGSDSQMGEIKATKFHKVKNIKKHQKQKVSYFYVQLKALNLEVI